MSDIVNKMFNFFHKKLFLKIKKKLLFISFKPMDKFFKETRLIEKKYR